MNLKNFPETIEMEKQLISAMFMKDGLVVPDVAAIIDPDDLYRVEYRLVFQAILRLYAKKLPIDYLAVEEELRKTGDFGKIEHHYLLSLIDATFTTARAEYHASIIKEKANLRKLIELSNVLIDQAQRGEKSFAEILSYAQSHLSNWNRSALPSKLKKYANRLTGFKNIDEQQFSVLVFMSLAQLSPSVKLLSAGNFSNNLPKTAKTAFSVLMR